MNEPEKIKLLEKQVELLEKIIELQVKFTPAAIILYPNSPIPNVYPTYPQPWTSPWYSGDHLYDFKPTTICGSSY